MTEIEDLVARLRLDATEFEGTIARANESIKNFDRGTQSSKESLGGLDVGLMNAANALSVYRQGLELANSAYNTWIAGSVARADAIKDLTHITGMNTDEVQRWRAACRETGTDAAALTSTLRIMTSRMAEGGATGAELRDSLKQIGVTLYDQEGNWKSTSDVLRETIVALGKMENTYERNRIAMQVFGRGWAELAPLIDESTEAINAFDAADPVSEKDIEDMHRYQIEVDKMGAAWDKVAMGVAERWMPALTALASYIRTTVIPAVDEILNRIEYAGNQVGWFFKTTDINDFKNKAPTYEDWYNQRFPNTAAAKKSNGAYSEPGDGTGDGSGSGSGSKGLWMGDVWVANPTAEQAEQIKSGVIYDPDLLAKMGVSTVVPGTAIHTTAITSGNGAETRSATASGWTKQADGTWVNAEGHVSTVEGGSTGERDSIRIDQNIPIEMHNLLLQISSIKDEMNARIEWLHFMQQGDWQTAEQFGHFGSSWDFGTVQADITNYRNQIGTLQNRYTGLAGLAGFHGTTDNLDLNHIAGGGQMLSYVTINVGERSTADEVALAAATAQKNLALQLGLKGVPV